MALNVQSFQLGPIMTNAYLLWDSETKRGVVVDPGSQPKTLIDAIRNNALQIEAILLTHAHFDHIGGVDDVYDATKAPVIVHQNEADWLTNPELNGSAYSGLNEVRVRKADTLIKEDGTRTWSGWNVQMFHTPGHSPGSVSYYWKEEQLLISGDVLFQGSVGRTDLPGGDYDTLMASVRTLMELPDETRVLPGHGPETTIAQEQYGNPYVSGW